MDDKGTRNQIVPVGMYDKIYVQEGKGIKFPQCYFRCFILSWPVYKQLSYEKGILVDIFLFSIFHFFNTYYQPHSLVTKLNFMKIIAIIPQSIWTLLGL